MIKIKRAYEHVHKEDGYRILVDRLWPRGVSKETLKVDEWSPDISPSSTLRKEFNHKLENWPSFENAYKQELRRRNIQEKLQDIVKRARHGHVTLVYGAKDEEHNNAVVLKEVLENIKTRKP